MTLSNVQPQEGFWRGYVRWLRGRRRTLLLLAGLLLAVFLAGIWISAAPEDPFVYADIY